MKKTTQNLASPTTMLRPIGESSTGFRYSVSYRTISKAKSTEPCSGDAFKCGHFGEDQFLILLSDGMGSGINAHQRSSRAVKMVSKILNMGFSIESAIKFVNNLLIQKNSDEIFATLDLIQINLVNLECRLVKAGCNNTYIKRRNGEIKTISNYSLPIGIMDEVNFENHFVQLEDGDTIVICTDGIENPQMLWIADYLQNITTDSCDELGQKLLSKAEIINEYTNDDMTVIVVRIHRIINTDS